eukprot:5347315-Pyramimonas_sp.AAC.1
MARREPRRLCRPRPIYSPKRLSRSVPWPALPFAARSVPCAYVHHVAHLRPPIVGVAPSAAFPDRKSLRAAR